MAEAGGRLLLVGRNSFIAGHLANALPAGRVKPVAHGELDDPGLLDGVDAVINCARHPGSGRDGYDLERLDPDLALARRLGERDLPYVMLSSRKVYAPSAEPLAETAPLGPGDAYGRNKLAAEARLRAVLGERLTILRLANIFGDERVAGRRSFLAMLLGRLADDNRIRYDMSPFVERDFLPVETLAALLARIARAPPGGVMNVGSGIGLATGRLALWIMEGYGGGELLIDSYEEKDPFVLDIGKLRERYGRPCTRADLEARCRDLGRRLRAAAPA